MIQRNRVSITGHAANTGVGLSALAVSSPTGLATYLGAAAVMAPPVTDFLARALSHRERDRGERLTEMGRDAYLRNVSDGAIRRQDGFFVRDPSGRSAADEAIEAVLIVAKSSYEERKLPYLAHLLGRVPFDVALTAPVANRVIRMAEELSWTQYVLLAAIRQESPTLPDVQIGSHSDWESWSVHGQLAELRERGLIGSKMLKTGWGGVAYPDVGLRRVALDKANAVARAATPAGQAAAAV